MGGIENIIQTAKSLPIALYHLVLINIILFVGLVIKELTLLYLFGSLVFMILLILAVSKATNLWVVPDQLISQEVTDRLNEMNEEWKGWIKYMEIRTEATSAISRVITVKMKLI